MVADTDLGDRDVDFRPIANHASGARREADEPPDRVGGVDACPRLKESAEEAGARAEITTDKLYPAFKHDESDPVVQKAVVAAKRVGREPRLLASGGGSDANIFNGYGVPTVNLGIGYEEIHTTQERMPIAELVKAAELVVALVEVSREG